ncbi:hypothetical protein GCM10020331_056670 [Ectobacillus funiculus]
MTVPVFPKKTKKFNFFKPGFTSKYDESGIASTGIGLSYVKELTEELGAWLRCKIVRNILELPS